MENNVKLTKEEMISKMNKLFAVSCDESGTYTLREQAEAMGELAKLEIEYKLQYKS